MRNRLKILYKRMVAGTLAVCSALAAYPQANSKELAALDDMDFIEMINSVDTGKHSDLIQQFQTREAKNRLLNGKYNPKGECTVESYRNKEVLLITIPAHLLFEANATELKKGAEEYLSPLKRYLKDPDMYRMLLVMHTDNTGSEAYRDQLTADRVNAVADWFEETGLNTDYLFSYAMSDEMPLVDNNSMENRDKNRRLEIYLMPGEKMIDQAKKGRISF